MIAHLQRVTRAQWLVFGTFSVVGVLLLVLFLYCITAFFSYRHQVSDMMPRVARLGGMLTAANEIRAADASASEQIQAIMYVGNNANSMGVSMQQKIRSIFTGAGMVVSGSNIRSPKVFEDVTQIGVTISAEGKLSQLEEVLTELTDVRPLVIIERIEVQPERRRSNETSQQVDVRVQLYSMKFNDA